MERVRVVRLVADAIPVPLVRQGTVAKALLWPGMGAKERQLLYFDFRSGGSSLPLRHASEAVYYVSEGGGHILHTDTGEVQKFSQGAMIYVSSHQGYVLGGHCIFIGGPCPADPALTSALPHGSAAIQDHDRGDLKGILVLQPDKDGIAIPLIAKRAWLVIGPHMGASHAVMNLVELAPGERNTPHAHPQSEDTIFLVAGSGFIHDLTNNLTLPIEAGSAVIVPPGIDHMVEGGPAGMKSVGGPVPPDPRIVEMVGQRPD